MTITSADVVGATQPSPKQRGNRATRVPAILEVAINVFATLGNAGFTQRRIANDAGIRLRTLQHYFGTREELLRATIEENSQRHLRRYMALATDKRLSPERRLDAIVDQAVAVLTSPESNVSAFTIECWSLAAHEEFARALIEKLTGEYQGLLVRLVGEINPTLTVAECTLRGAQLLSHLCGLFIYIRQAGVNRPDMDAFQRVTKVVWKAISKAPQ
ncbi:TetR/AcrR family transcriptional regulator [Paraburkholderia sp. PGU19]|uniref:TetR/AcrR family transcriptional regulator n=1 Tax=Paraburkholderia sp. PGU19 TaxID=2735434 RepID=UPI001FB06BEB|nr:TetR/AcrR family transcriptional regulator [Paraburkholderia sp. PGU19]